ncbi:MAG: HD domain-containing phosphohydrolase, partial [Chloroflexota bacterium]
VAAGILAPALAYIILQEKLPTLVRDKSQIDIRAEASSLLAFANWAGDLDSLTAYVTESIAREIGVSGASLLLFTEDGLKVAATSGDWTHDPIRQTQLPVWGSYVSQDQLFPFLAPPGSGCHLFVPIEHRGERLGMLCIGAKKTGGFTQQDIELLSEVRKGIATPLRNAIQLEKVSRRHVEGTPESPEKPAGPPEPENVKASSETAYLEAARTLVLMLESRNPGTRGHSERVARLCADIARGMELTAEERETLELAARFHDIGQVAISDSILLKRAPLDPHERAEMESHPAKSVEILRFLASMERALPIIEAHHEAWDGSGYPKRLQGMDIPLGARILAVADAYDTMTSPDPCPSLDVAEAIRRLESGSGFQWDPQVVNALVKAVTGSDGGL